MSRYQFIEQVASTEPVQVLALVKSLVQKLSGN